jgi:hypothetical protein
VLRLDVATAQDHAPPGVAFGADSTTIINDSVEAKMNRLLPILLFLISAAPAAAVDHPVEGDRMRIQDPGDPSRRRFYFRAVKEAQITGATIADPTIAGATVEVFGAGAGDGNSGAIFLPAANWKPLIAGNGYYYRDHAASHGGITQVRIKRRVVGGALIISARGSSWPYVVSQAQTGVKVRLTIDTRVYCTEFATMFPNRAGIVLGRNNPAPAACN